MPILSSGNFNVTSLITPDLYVVIVPPSQLSLNGVPSNVVGMVGLASWGPTNTATQVGSMADYASKFGQILNRKYDMATATAIAAQQGANAFSCVRATDGSDVKASVVVGSTNITFTAKYSGVLGNSVRVTVGNGSKANSYRFTVGSPGYVSETFDNIVSTPTTVVATTTALSSSSTTLTVPTAGITTGMVVSGTGISGSPTVSSITDSAHLVVSAAQTVAISVPLTFTAANNSVWVACANAISQGQAGRLPSVWITATAGSGTVAPSVGTTYQLASGTDGDATVTSATLIGSATLPATGMYALSGTGFAILDVVDMDDATQWTTVDAFANAESGYAVVQGASGLSIAATVTAKQSAGLDSYNTKILLGDFLWWNDPILQTARLVAPQHFVAGRLGNLTPQLTALNKQIYSVAGSSRTGLVGATAVVSPYSRTEIDTLVLNGLDVVTNPGAANFAIWTCRTGHNSSSDGTRHLDNYPTLTNYIAKTVSSGMGAYLGQTITPTLFGNIRATLSFFLQTLAGAGLLVDPSGATPYSVVCDISNNPSAQTNNGVVTADVVAKFASIVEKLVVNLQGGNTVSVTSTRISNTQ